MNYHVNTYQSYEWNGIKRFVITITHHSCFHVLCNIHFHWTLSVNGIQFCSNVLYTILWFRKTNVILVSPQLQ